MAAGTQTQNKERQRRTNNKHRLPWPVQHGGGGSNRTVETAGAKMSILAIPSVKIKRMLTRPAQGACHDMSAMWDADELGGACV